MKKYLLIFAAIFVLCCHCLAEEQTSLPYKEFKPFKMVFLPDIHLSFQDKESNILYKESHVILQDVLKNLNQEKTLDFVVFGGNLTSNDDNKFSDMPMFLDTVAELQAKYYAILGDREAAFAEGFSKEDFTREFDEFSFKTMSQTFWAAEPVKDVLLIGLDSSVKNEEAGYLNMHQLFWLDNTLKNNMKKFTIIAMHHPPLLTCDVDKTNWEKYMLKKPDLFLELINLYPQVKIILSGHHFSNFTKKNNKKFFITCPSIVVYPNMYKTFTVYPERIEVDNETISFKQLIKKAEELLVKSSYAEEFSSEKPKSALKYQRGDKFSNKKEYYFENKKRHSFLWF